MDLTKPLTLVSTKMLSNSRSSVQADLIQAQKNCNFKMTKVLCEGFQLDENSFQLEEVIGKGGYALVWKAVARLTKKNYAIKIIDKFQIFKKNCLRSILNERQILS